MDFLGRGEPSFFLTLLAYWMECYVAGTYLASLTSIAAVDFQVALVLAVAGVLGTDVLGTEPGVSQLGTAGRRAGTFSFAWHQPHRPLLGKTKPSGK